MAYNAWDPKTSAAWLDKSINHEVIRKTKHGGEWRDPVSDQLHRA